MLPSECETTVVLPWPAGATTRIRQWPSRNPSSRRWVRRGRATRPGGWTRSMELSSQRSGKHARSPPRSCHPEINCHEHGHPLLAAGRPPVRCVRIYTGPAKPGHRTACSMFQGPLMKRFLYRVDRLLNCDPSYSKACLSANRLRVPKGNSRTEEYEPLAEYRRLARPRDQPGLHDDTAIEGIGDTQERPGSVRSFRDIAVVTAGDRQGAY